MVNNINGFNQNLAFVSKNQVNNIEGNNGTPKKGPEEVKKKLQEDQVLAQNKELQNQLITYTKQGFKKTQKYYQDISRVNRYIIGMPSISEMELQVGFVFNPFVSWPPRSDGGTIS